MSDSIREFWNARYAQGLVYGTEPTSVAPVIADALRAARLQTVLEAGCGSGRDALYYARQGFEVTALDLSEQALARAKERAAREGLGLRFIAADLLAADLTLAGFDAAVAIHLIHLQPEPVRMAMVNRLWQLTVDGGLIATANYSVEEAGFTTWPAHTEPNTRVDPKGKVVHFFDEADIQSLFPPARFDLVTCEQVDLAETPDSGPAIHREWLTIARKVCAC
jgi:SAM-dependent methyltransferase